MRDPAVLGIVGSPRRGGNTGTLVSGALGGAADAGAQTRLLYLDDQRIHPCLACMACKAKDRCVQSDGMERIYPLLEQSTGLVLGSPIYFDHVSAQTKLFLDRLFPYVGPNMEKRFPTGVKAVIILTWEATDPSAYDDVGEWLAGRLAYYYDIEVVDRVLVSSTESVPVRTSTETQQRAYRAGVVLAQAMRGIGAEA